MAIPQMLAALGSFVSMTGSRIAANWLSRKIDPPNQAGLAKQSQNQQIRKAEAEYLRGKAKREQELVKIQADLAKMREIEIRAGMEIAAAQAEREERALEISEKELQLKKQALQLAKERLKQEGQVAEVQQQQVERVLQLRERELEILAEERAQRLQLSYLHLQLVQENKAREIDLKLKEIQAEWDKENWSGLLSREEMRQILIEGRQKHRLLMLVSPPDIKGCPDFDSNLHKAVRSELKEFMEKYYPLHSDLCPVEFYGKFFKSSVFDTEVKQYERDLAPIPTVVIYSDVTNDKVYFHIHVWGLAEPVSMTFPWNWREERDKLEASEGKTRDESLRIIRDALVKSHQLLAAFLADLYYLEINPSHEIRLFQLDGDFPSEWIKSQFQELSRLQQEKIASYGGSLMNSQDGHMVNLSDQLPIPDQVQPRKELTICFVGKTGAGKSTLINAFYNWCLGVDGKNKTERKYCISTRSQKGNRLEAEEQFAHLNTENQQRAKGASATTSPSKYTFNAQFNAQDFVVHIIDTPGFADTTGVETDRSHMKQILEQITQLNQVHIFGIVWNEKRLTTEQKFVVGCLKELLPKDRYKNLVVCVTNTLEVDADTKDAIAAAGLEQCPVICFDNLWVTAEDWGRVSLMFRNEANESFNELIRAAEAAEPVSSKIFQNIVRKRKELEKNRSEIYAQIATLNNHKQALKKVICELDDLSKDISNIKLTRIRISAKETPATWNTYCTVCGSNCHVNCGLSYKQSDLSSCSAMDSKGICTKCSHRYTVHTHECTKMEREEIREEITDDENLKKKQSKEQDLHNRKKLQQDINQKISSLDYEIEEKLKGLRLVVDELSKLVMAPFNPHYLDYLETLNEVAKQEGEVDIAKKLQDEINDYKTFIDMLKSGVEDLKSGMKTIINLSTQLFS
ncbi:MAG: 50S ribosome-binding GTPase [Oscillatoria princeps RMCB-10]|jgi:GTP-binding protein EngB required for normal cell division|nr:50S ribosome-binding GTPase [Oscillatoria princeps RMCB-10]